MSTIIRRFLSSPAVLTARILAAVAVIASTAQANPAIAFTLTHGSAESSPNYDWVKFGGGQFLAWSNEDATMSFSSDGRNWQHYPTGQGTLSVTDAIYGNGVWMSRWGSWMLLEDDFKWLHPEEFKAVDVAFGNGWWLALGNDGGIWRSTDARDWTRVADADALIEEARGIFPTIGPFTFVKRTLSFAGENFVIGAVLHSGDGIEWTITDEFPAAPPALTGPAEIFAPEYFGSPVGPYVTSSAISVGGEWRLTDNHADGIDIGESIRGVDYAFDSGIAALVRQITFLFHTSGYNRSSMVVSDGQAFYEKQIDDVAFRAVACGDGLAIGVTDTGLILIFDDGDWREHRLRSPAEIRDIAYGNGLWVAVGESGLVAISDSNGEKWNVHGVLRKVGYHNGRFLALGDDSALISDDGLEWSIAAHPPLETIGELRTEDGFVVYDAAGDQSAYSSDGLIWTVRDQALPPLQATVPGLPVDITATLDIVSIETDKGITPPFQKLREFHDLAVGNGAAAITGHWSTPEAGFLSFDTAGNYHLKNIPHFPFAETFYRDGQLFAVAYGAGRFVLVGDGAVTFWTENFADYGTTEFLAPEEAWSTDEEQPNLFDIAYGNGRFVAVGAGNTIYTSEVAEAVHPTRGEIWAAGDEWYQHQQYGWFYPMENGWDWHLSLGWVLPSDAATDFWIWLEKIGWAWSDIDTLPWVYLSDQQQWWTVDLYTTVPNLVFWRYDEASQQWVWQTQGEF